MDQRRNLSKKKLEQDRVKQKIVEKHMRMEEYITKTKETRAHMVEYHRIANELRLQKGNASTR